VVDLHHLLLAGLPAHLCENCEVEFAGRNFVSTSSILKIAMPATTVGRSLKRKQFCAFLARARFHTAWTRSGASPPSFDALRKVYSITSSARPSSGSGTVRP